AQALAMLDRRTEARAAFHLAHTLLPLSATVLYRYGQALWRWGETAEAEEKLRAALARRTSFIAPRLTLAALLHANGQPDEAQIEYARCVDLAPTGADTHLDSALDLLRHGDRDQATAEARRALDLEPAEVSPSVVEAFLDYLQARQQRTMSSDEASPPAPNAAASPAATIHTTASGHLTPPIAPAPAESASLASGTRHIFHTPSHAPASTDAASAPQTQAEPNAPLRVATLPTTSAAPSTVEPQGEDASREGTPSLSDATPSHKKGKPHAPKIPKAERTQRPGWLARLFHWGR
ncbi:MAG TPA: tetratricopeptide repeat protein, partial [Ktedonobacterales bacterium]